MIFPRLTPAPARPEREAVNAENNRRLDEQLEQARAVSNDAARTRERAEQVKRETPIVLPKVSNGR